MKLVDLHEPTSFLDHVHFGCTQRECKSNESIFDEYREMFESRISARATEKVLGWEKSHANTKIYCELAKKSEQLCKVCTPCLDDHQFKM